MANHAEDTGDRLRVNGPALPTRNGQHKARKVGASKQPKHTASIYGGLSSALPEPFVKSVQKLEDVLGMPVWLLIQRHHPDEQFHEIDGDLVNALLANRQDLPDESPVAVLIHSPGGYASCAYQIANVLRNQCGQFTAIVPRWAKSAATLLALGAEEILLGKDGELGPWDAQLQDHEREMSLSALDEVQSLERLHAFALEAFDRTTLFLIERTNKKLSTLLPMALSFTSDIVRPLFERIDVVRYTQMSRILKVAEEYAVRLLQEKYLPEQAKRIASHLVGSYPEHVFAIDAKEASRIKDDLQLDRPVAVSASMEQQEAFQGLLPYLGKLVAIGRLKEV